MRCQEYAARVTEHMEGTLSPADRKRAERHLASCADCARHLQQIELMLSQLAELRQCTRRKDPRWP